MELYERKGTVVITWISSIEENNKTLTWLNVLLGSTPTQHLLFTLKSNIKESCLWTITDNFPRNWCKSPLYCGGMKVSKKIWIIVTKHSESKTCFWFYVRGNTLLLNFQQVRRVETFLTVSHWLYCLHWRMCSHKNVFVYLESAWEGRDIMRQWTWDGPFLDHDLEMRQSNMSAMEEIQQMHVWKFKPELTTTAKYSMNRKARLLV